MIKKSLKKAITVNVFAEEKPKEKKEKAKKEYTNLIEPQELLIADKAKLVFSASVPKEGEEDSPVHLDIRTFIVNPDTTKYSGPTQKGINFDVEYLDEVIEILRSVSEGFAKQGK